MNDNKTMNMNTNDYYTLTTDERNAVKATLAGLQQEAYFAELERNRVELADGLSDTDTLSQLARDPNTHGGDNYRRIARRAEDAYRVAHGIRTGEYFRLETSDISNPELCIALAVRVTSGYLRRTYSRMGTIKNMEYLREPMFSDLVGIVLVAWAETYGYTESGANPLDDNAGAVAGLSLSQYLNRHITLANGDTLNHDGGRGAVSSVETATTDVTPQAFKRAEASYYKALDDILRQGETDFNYSFEYITFWRKFMSAMKQRATANKRYTNAYKALQLRVYHGMSNADIAGKLGVTIATVQGYVVTWSDVAHEIATSADVLIANNKEQDKEIENGFRAIETKAKVAEVLQSDGFIIK